MTAKLVLYLHGFASSSQSEKALLTAEYFQQHLPQHQLLLPDLPYTPLEAVQCIVDVLQGRIPDAVIGSSLGGFLATRLAQQFQCKAVLINPAVQPHLLLQQHLGRYFHPVLQRHYDVSAEHLPQLARLAPEKPAAHSLIKVLLQTGDEVLDYREALDFYQHCQLDVQEGGDHSYQGYANRLPDIVKFCQLA
ncbi:alpha/beta fold hydrolase [Rheinheimera riviphila]|uniref:Alpha/beta fold hydrolase n=1 Tax=Rheinheimera riviphila TaxID=1834037 RepID=A0A437QF05_9GAMM|nr:YqiA/YcfP family alpha/beta fold hydrolase [Rheinheimera riviphila]RVU33158.1 alpha/beta fold hydrolase [Rheinheimera riviphila]